MSCDKEHPLENTESFKQIYSGNVNDTMPLYIYRSVKTGITVCIAQSDGPFIDSDFNIVTETFDNDGLSYAVQHLIFTGSDDYNNNLKLWANRSLASNINASTLQNRTCFSMRAAGSETFLTLMPKYLNHILYPTLKDTAYLTEVHHITGKANDGIVYRKIQIKERTSDYIIQKKMLRFLYPGKCGYNSLIYGTTKNLRESTNNEKIKQFHKKFYRPENLTILITGKINHSHIFQALLPLEQKIMSKKRNDIFERPWQTPIEQLKKSVDVDVIFPSLYKTHGDVYVAWRGPSAVTQEYDYHGCVALLKYITNISSSPIKTNLGVHSCIVSNSTNWSVPYLKIIFKNIPIEQIDLITKESIHNVLSTTYTNGINMKTIKNFIHKSIFDYQIDFEINPHKNIANFLFDHLLHENTNNLDQRLNIIHNLEKLKNESDKHFLDLFKHYFVDAPMVIVKGKPSVDEYFKLQEEEKHVTEQITKFGQKGLKQKDKELQQAIEKLNKGVPKEVQEKILIPGIESITFHDIQRYNTETLEQHPKFDVKKLPFFTYLDHVNTNFFYLHVIMDTSSISLIDKSYIPLLAEVLTKSPVKRGNQLIPSGEVQDLLLADNIKVHSHIGINTSEHIAHTMSLMFQVEFQNYEKSVQYCKEFLYHTKITVESLKIALTRLLDINKIMQGETLAVILMDTLLHMDGDHNSYTPLWQHKFLNAVQEILNTDVGQKKVLAQIESIRKVLTSPRNMFVHMGVNVDKLTEYVPDVYAPWNKYFSEFMSSEKTKITITSKSKRTPPRYSYNGCIMGMKWIKSSVLLQSCPCINDFQHSDLPALEVCLTYLTQEGGPIWEELREQITLADHYSLFTAVTDGNLHLELVSTTNLVAAYNKIKLTVEAHLAGNKWNYYLYEKAKSSVILKNINMVHSIQNMINASLTSYCKNMPHDYIYQMVRRVFVVSMDDMSHVLTRYIKPLFDFKICKLAIVCTNDKSAEITEAFEKMKFKFNIYTSINELYHYIENMTMK